MGNCPAKQRRMAAQRRMEAEQAAVLERAGLAAGGSSNDAAIASSDQVGALSGYGSGHGGYGYVHEEECPEGTYRSKIMFGYLCFTFCNGISGNYLYGAISFLCQITKACCSISKRYNHWQSNIIFNLSLP